jgi:hypothetical protein
MMLAVMGAHQDVVVQKSVVMEDYSSTIRKHNRKQRE